MTLCHGYETEHIGTFSTPKEAAEVYAAAIAGTYVKPARELPVGVRRQSGRFQARLWDGRKSLVLGTFDTPEEASVARNAAKTGV